MCKNNNLLLKAELHRLGLYLGEHPLGVGTGHSFLKSCQKDCQSWYHCASAEMLKCSRDIDSKAMLTVAFGTQQCAQVLGGCRNNSYNMELT